MYCWLVVGYGRFPEVFDCIARIGSNNDCYFENDVFPKNKYVHWILLNNLCLVLVELHIL